MKPQFRKPWFIVAAAFILVMTVWVRVAEYRLPLKAAQLEQEFIEAYESSKTPTSHTTESNNVFELYDQAKTIMTPDIHKGTYQWHPAKEDIVPEWAIGRIRHRSNLYHINKGSFLIPPPSRPIPEDTVKRMREIVEKYRPALDILRQAQKLPLPDTAESIQASIDVHRSDTDDIKRYQDHYVRANISKLLLLVSILGVLENNAEEAVGALETLHAFIDAEKTVAFLTDEHLNYYDFRNLLGYSKIFNLAMYGLERDVFSEAYLNRIDLLLETKTLLSNTEFMMARHIHNTLRNEKTAYQKQVAKEKGRQWKIKNRIFPLLGDGLQWCETRLRSLRNTENLSRRQYIQHRLLHDNLTHTVRYYGRLLPYNPHVYDLYNRVNTVSFKYLSDAVQWQLYSKFWNDTYRHLLRTALAAGKYRCRKGVFPEKITQLAPEYLSAASLDHLLRNRFVYERTETGWIIFVWGEKEKRAAMIYPLEDYERWGKK